MTESLESKYKNLIDTLRSYGKVAVAFSSGVDSTFLLYAAKEALGSDAVAVTGASSDHGASHNLIAVTVSADFVAEREKDEAGAFCRDNGIEHIICDVSLDEIPHFSENPPDRCYYCKHHIFENILRIAGEHGISAVVEGSNLDDNGDYRPGHRAIAELGIKSPLRDCGFTKAEIREVSRHLGLPTWKKPSFACLASRVPYGDIITTQKLSMIDKSEDILLSMGFSQFRVRVHVGSGGVTGVNASAGAATIGGIGYGESSATSGPTIGGASATDNSLRGSIARIELLPEDFPRFMEDDIRAEVYDRFKEIGFSYVALDIKGYRTGSLNETLN